MSVLHDLYCPACEKRSRNRAVEPSELPLCRCGTPMRVDWSHGQAPRVDAHEPRYMESVDLWYSSRRELERKAAARGWHAAGDRIGGALNTRSQRRGTLYGGGGMRSSSGP